MKTFSYPKNKSQIPSFVRFIERENGGIRYACPDCCWASHFACMKVEMIKDPNAPLPMPEKHIMFEDEISSFGVVQNFHNS